MSFASLPLSKEMIKALNLLTYTKPYPIQEQAIPAVLAGKDVLAIAQTGSGKTASFAIPILELLQKLPIPKHRHIQALVMVPTRELAMQVAEVFQLLGKDLPRKIKTMPVYGGVSINPQMIKLRGIDILVATPGRLLDLIESKAVFLSQTNFLVLDEADKMLNMGFKEEMEKIFKLLPYKRQNLLFSATLKKDINDITEFLLHSPIKIEIEEKETSIENIQQEAYTVCDEKKGPLLRYLIKSKEMKQVLVFTSSIHKADVVVKKLNANKIQAEAIHSQKSQGARTRALLNFKNGSTKVLVATDIMSRGIDVPELPFVINYELPRSPKDYIHRIGRTGRADAIGTAIALISPEEEHHFKVIQKKMKKQVPYISSEEINLHGF